VNSFSAVKAKRTVAVPAALPPDRAASRYAWPYPGALSTSAWRFKADIGRIVRRMPETREEIAADSRWPCLFSLPDLSRDHPA